MRLFCLALNELTTGHFHFDCPANARQSHKGKVFSCYNYNSYVTSRERKLKDALIGSSSVTLYNSGLLGLKI